MNPVEIAFQKGYRCDRDGKVTGTSGIILKTRLLNGYPYFKIKVASHKSKNVRVHRLQGLQKFGAVIFEKGIEVRHLDGNSQNASWDNLAIGTAVDNASDKTADAKSRGGIAARKHDHLAIQKHFDNFGFAATLATFQIGKGTLSYILRKSISARTYLDRRLKGAK